ncbi:SH3 type 3 domain protein [Oscillochloris trichoides DG-6]|uniref:SH3 type 3 domain protein n=1 Tax=Oscillochloris trichoides DG-6 TaxID=765420 RepID=E1IEC7_9CHLR|nr:SH3 domain-containing protein [Oscillochloris trichoides]EFO80453.1 SH3 type 3 domain protein [Oscillochloris trichoides DG-6]
MQDLLSRLNPMIAIILIVAGVIALVVVVILARRLRRGQPSLDESISVAPTLGGTVDYTSLPLDEEPTGWRDRFARLSLAGKILLILVPILVILGLLVLILTLMGGNQPPPAPPAPTATPEPISITLTKADIIRVTPITLSVVGTTTGLADATEVTIALLADGAPLAYFDPTLSVGQVSAGRIDIKAIKLESAEPLRENVNYTVQATTSGGEASAEMPLGIPASYAPDLFGTAEAEPTPTLEPTSTPSTVETATPEVSPTPTIGVVSGTEVAVVNGGNVRALPFVMPNNRVGGVDAGNRVQIIEQTPNGEWYRISFINTDDGQQKEGWISASLLSVTAEMKAQVPVATIVTVFVAGSVYTEANTTSKPVDQVNVYEIVNLKQKTADGTWYEIETVRGNSGWVAKGLLGIPDDVAAKVPVAP